MDVNARILAKRYARAYMALDGKPFGAALEAQAKGKLDGLAKVLETARPHMRALTHPCVNSAVRLEVLAKVLGPANSGPAAAFAALLVQQGRFGLLEEIMKDCGRIYDAFRGVVRAEVYSRFPLSEGEVKRIDAILAASTGAKIGLRQELEERVIGGFEIKIGDTLIDATARGKLRALRAGLLN
ncbi:MAG: ATP synthase F1 subunit delta [Elusimicrobia bacterium]|nr:ATP synthase F1 subunit delta [Elusimicrobiota bacterium]